MSNAGRELKEKNTKSKLSAGEEQIDLELSEADKVDGHDSYV